MRKSLIGIGLVFIAQNVFAAVPTTDFAVLAQVQQQVAKAAEQISQLKQQYNQAKEQFNQNMSWEVGNGWHGIQSSLPQTSYLPADWQDITKIDVSTLRQRYGLTSDDPKEQDFYDRQLRYLGANEKAYTAQQQHVRRLKALEAKANTVRTPREREELMTALQSEQQQMAIEHQQLESLNESMNREDRIETARVNADFGKQFQSKRRP